MAGMTIQVQKYEIPNGAITPGDTFNLNIPLGAKFMKIDVIADVPYLLFVIDTEKGLQARKFIYTDDDYVFSENEMSYVGHYATATPANNFYVFEWLGAVE